MNDPDPSFLFRHEGRAAPEPSPDFENRVLGEVSRYRRRASNRRAVLGGLLPLLIVAASLYSLNKRNLDPRGNAARDGVDWLLAQQQPDGGWSATAWGGHARFSTGVAALATLALLHAPDGVPTDALEAAGNWLEVRLDPRATLNDEGPGLYNHLFTLRALLEIEVRSPQVARRALLRQSLASLLRQQQPDGGWGYAASQPMSYGTNTQTRSNSAVTWWVLRLLREGEFLALPGQTPARDRGERWLADHFDPAKGPRYVNGTPALGPDAALYWMARITHAPRNGVEESVQSRDAYRDLFRMSALSRVAPFRDVIHAQQSNGSWAHPGDRWGSAGGQIYVTAAAVLALSPQGG